MKTTILNFSAVALLLGSSFFAGRIQFSEKDPFTNDSNTKIENQYVSGETNVITRATINKGEIIPMVDLPEFTVESEAKVQYLVNAHIIDGEIVPFVTLPTLSIEG